VCDSEGDESESNVNAKIKQSGGGQPGDDSEENKKNQVQK